MKNLLTNPAAKAAALLLCLLVSVGAAWTTLLTIARWDELWSGGDFYRSSLIQEHLSYAVPVVEELGMLYQLERWDGGLNYRDQQRRSQLDSNFAVDASNFRFRIHNQAGEFLCGNVTGQELEQQAADIYMLELMVYQSQKGIIYSIDNYAYPNTYQQFGDYQIWDAPESRYLLKIYVDGVEKLLKPEESAEARRYGWSYLGNEWGYNASQDSRVKNTTLVLEYGLAKPLLVHDEYAMLQSNFINFQDSLPIIAAAALFLDLLTGVLLIFLCTAAGRRAGAAGVQPNLLDRIPYDLLLVLVLLAGSALIAAGDYITYAVGMDGLNGENLVGLTCISLGVAGCTLATILTTATRIKTRRLLRNTLVWRCCRAIGRGCRATGRFFAGLVRNWPMVWRAVLALVLYWAVSLLTLPTVVLFLAWQGLVLWAAFRWIKQWQSIRRGAAHIVGGDPDFIIDTRKMFPDLKEHATQLNDLGSAISTAVDERLKSERFKAELITNVSHDLKTPLTSIINYVDLLKKEEIENPKAQEYLEVLERKSQRLKKLTEDLVEASKASTGNLSVVKTRLGMCQLVEQAVAEYEEKFRRNGLALVMTVPEAELYVEADGRHVWRILDNLLGNCCKYALEGTRVYLDVTKREGAVSLLVKNVSRQQLNVTPDQLMERFVRGEESRTTEGSGLGLSIARSLTELQGGAFRLEIDGDLFKAIVTLPEADLESLPAQDLRQELPPG